MTHKIVFEDNKLIPMLYGEQNSHLKIIEKALSIEINDRGNELSINGSESNISQAETLIETLWGRLQEGHVVDKESVNSALRFLKEEQASLNGFQDDKFCIHTKKLKVKPRSPNQSAYIQAMEKSDLVFGMGPAGTGKTYLAIAMAVSMLERGIIERIILSRPAIEAGENIGFLPGEMKEKMDPYMRPLYDALHHTMGAEKVVKKIASEEIEIAPLAFMRGRSLNHAFVILDEAQNTTSMQMLMFLTRLGENSRMVVTGDPGQVDLPKNQVSGLSEAKQVLIKEKNIDFIQFEKSDIVRNKLVTRIVHAYDDYKKKT